MGAEAMSVKTPRARLVARPDITELTAEFRVHSAVDLEQFRASDRRLGDIEKRFDKVDERIGGMDTSIKKLSDRIAWAGWSLLLGLAALIAKSFVPGLH